MTRGKRPVFVVGSPRSGTTFLYDALQSTGGFPVYNRESHVFSGLVTRVGNLSVPRNREKLIAKWLESQYFKPIGVDVEEVKLRFLRDGRNGGDFLRFVMEDMAHHQNMERWADHTPDHVLYMQQIKSTIPDALFIHLVRDGRDVALSLDKQGYLDSYLWHKRYGVMVCGIYWEWTVEAGMQQGARMRDSYLEVRYEDLIGKPHETFARIGNFLDQEMEWERIRRAGIGAVSNPNTAFSAGSNGGDFSPICRWKTAFPKDDLPRFESMLGPCLQRLGYGLGTATDELPKSTDLWALRTYYRLYFSSRLWIKAHNVPMARFFVRDRM